MSLRKLTPLERMAMISVWYAIFEVKKMTAMKGNRPLNWLMK